MNPVEAPAAKAKNLISMIYEIRQASSKADFQSKLNTTLIRRVRNTENEEFVLGGTVYFIAANRKKNEEENGYVLE